jgi:hypothetical protein
MPARSRTAGLVPTLLASALLACSVRAAAACSSPMGTQEYRLGEGAARSRVARTLWARPAPGALTHPRQRRGRPKPASCVALHCVAAGARQTSQHARNTATHTLACPRARCPHTPRAGPAAHAKRLASSNRWQDKNAVDFRAPAGAVVVVWGGGR